MRKILLSWILVSIVFISNSVAQDWELNTKTIPEPYLNSVDAHFGKSVAIDGNYAVAGAPEYDDARGSAYILYFNGAEWETIAKLSASDGYYGDQFGRSVSISGDYIAIGADDKLSIANTGGKAYVFEKPINGWIDMTETAMLTGSDAVKGDGFACSVSISGDIVIVGSKNDNVRKGSAYVFKKSINGWGDMTETAKLTPSDAESDYYFGCSVSVSGEYIVIGASGDDNGSKRGKAYIFEKPINGWVDMTETAMLTGSDIVKGDGFACSVNISGNQIVIGAKDDDDNGYNSGSVYVFEKPVSGWVNCTETAKLTALDADSYDNFGCSVAISDNTIIVGANQYNKYNNDGGYVYLFEKPEGGWTNVTENVKFIASDGMEDDNLGFAVGISGEHLLVGAFGIDENDFESGAVYYFQKPTSGWKSSIESAKIPLKDYNNYLNYYGKSISIDGNYAVVGSSYKHAGCAYVLEFNGSKWITIAKLMSSDGENGDNFGTSVDILNDIIVVGSSGDNDNGSKSGSVYIFKKPINGWVDMSETAKLTASDGSGEDYFGISVSISNNTIVVGASGDDDNGSMSGSAYVFEKPKDGWETMNETAKLSASDASEYDKLGINVRNTDDIILLSETYDINKAEKVYLFSKPNGGWANMEETNSIAGSNRTNNDYFGKSLAIEGNFVVIGNLYGGTEDKGMVHVFQKSIDGWGNVPEIAILTASNGKKADNFGYSVDISKEHIIVGDPNHEVGYAEGAVYIFKETDNNWITSNEIEVLYEPNGSGLDDFGRVVSISDKHLLVSNPNEDDNGGNSGSVYFYKLKGDFDFNDLICEGEDFIYSISNQEAGATYQWQNFGSIWEDIVGETNDTLSILNVILDMNGSKYRCIISATENDTSDVATLTVNPTYNLPETVSINSGESYTFPDGTSQTNITSQVVYTSNLQTVFGCDSIIETTVDVNPIFSSTENVSVCAGSNYTFPDGTSQNNITTQVIYTSNLQSEFGCDSIIETTVDVNPTYNLTETVEINSGESYTFPDGNIQNNITSQVIYISNLQTVFGCDSIIETTVNVGDTEICYSSESVTICSGSDYTFPDGSTQNDITSQVVYESYIELADECDKIIETTVNVNPTDVTNLTETICQGESITIAYGLFSYTGLYGITLKNEFGCDSVIKLDLTVIDLKVNLGSDVSINLDDTLVLDAGEDFETYYWSTEESSQTIEIDGEIGIGAHIYNVRVTDINSCVASDTIIITVNSLTDIGSIHNLEGRVKVYPNPTSDKLNIEFVENTEAIEISLYDIIGNLLLQKEMKPQETKRTIQIPGENGVYFIRIRSEYSSKTYKIIKN